MLSFIFKTIFIIIHFDGSSSFHLSYEILQAVTNNNIWSAAFFSFILFYAMMLCKGAEGSQE